MIPDDPPVDPDPVVRTALQLLPTPPHREAFWTDLDRRLDRPVDGRRAGRLRAAPIDDAPADGTALIGPAAVPVLDLDPSLRLVPPALRRRSNAAAAVAAVAAAVLVVVAGATLVRQRSGSDVDTSQIAGPAPETTAPEVQATSTSTETSGGDSERAAEAVLAWVAALGDGDGDAAWAAMGPHAKQHLGTRDAFDEMMTGFSEGFGAWSAATPDQVLMMPVAEDGGGSLVIVTLVGVVSQEGAAQPRADAFAVRLVGGSVKIEPFDVAGEVEIVLPDETAGATATLDGDELVVVVPEGADAPILRLDDGPPVVCGQAEGTELTTLEETSGRRCSYSPEGGIDAGRRVLTVAFRGAGSGAISAESVLFEAA